MKYLKQFLIIIAITLLGELLHYLIPVSIPGSIYGMVLMFVFLELKIIKLEDVEATGSFLVEIMPVMFVPVCVGVLDSWDIIKVSWLKYVVLMIVSTIVVMVVTGKVTQLLIRKSAMKTTCAQASENVANDVKAANTLDAATANNPIKSENIENAEDMHE